MPYANALLFLAASSITQAYVVGRSAITDCLASANVPQDLPGSANFTQSSKPFNLRVAVTPAAIAIPNAAYDVQAAVRCAVNQGYTVSARSGGHSYASWGLGGENGHLVLDMKRFNQVKLDVATGVASVGAGSRLGNVALALYEQGKRGIPHGTCPEVGVGGLTLHGGYGYSSRSHGLTVDSLVEVEVVLADGSLARASKTENPELFWGLRGAGSSFGIVTNFMFQTFAAPEETTVFEYSIFVNPTEDEAAAAAKTTKYLKAIQDFANGDQPAELQTRVFMNKAVSVLIGTYAGSRMKFEAAIQPLLAEIGNPNGTIATKGWIDTLLNYSNGPLKQPLDGYDKHENFFAKSLMSPAVTEQTMRTIVNYYYKVGSRIGRDWFMIMDLHGGRNSAISAVPMNDTSYSHRDAVLKLQFYDRMNNAVPYPQDGFDFMNGWVSAIESSVGSETPIGMYANYADTSLSKSEAHQRYWGVHYDRLVSLKQRYDPQGLFSNPQSVDVR